MPRAPFNVLVIAYRVVGETHEYAVLHRADVEMWQFVAGGGEDDETPDQAARRELAEEAGITSDRWMKLDSFASVPRDAFPGAPWPDEVYVVPEYCFAVDVGAAEVVLCHEHDCFEWLDYEATRKRLTWDSNRNALWELRERLARQRPDP